MTIYHGQVERAQLEAVAVASVTASQAVNTVLMNMNQLGKSDV